MKRMYYVLPAYNEAGNLGVLIERIYRAMVTIRRPYGLIFVIQGHDGSLEEVRAKTKKYAILTLVRNFEHAIGVGPAFRTGFKLLPKDAEYVVTMDCDLNHDPKELSRLIQVKEETHAQLVVGSRYISGGKMVNFPPWKRVLSYYTNRLLMIFTGIPIVDKSSGYRLMDAALARRVSASLKEEGFGFYVEFLLTAYRFGYSIEEAPITFVRRVRGTSKMDIFQTLKSYMRLIVRSRSLARRAPVVDRN